MRVIATFLVTATFSAHAFFSNVAHADNSAAKAKAQICATCHGQNGISDIDIYPNLAGQKEKYLALQLKAYRDGTRVNNIMSPLAKGLTDKDIAMLAKYYSELK